MRAPTIGIALKKNAWLGLSGKVFHTSGNRAACRTETNRKKTNNPMLRQKTTTESQYSHVAS